MYVLTFFQFFRLSISIIRISEKIISFSFDPFFQTEASSLCIQADKEVGKKGPYSPFETLFLKKKSPQDDPLWWDRDCSTGYQSVCEVRLAYKSNDFQKHNLRNQLNILQVSMEKASQDRKGKKKTITYTH